MEQWNPLADPAPPEIHLADAPLVLALAQLRFPLVTSVSSQEFIGPFQEAIRGTYPILRQETGHVLAVGPSGEVATTTNKLWRFIDEADEWRVSLAPEFVAMETSRYTTRQEFLKRLGFILDAVNQHIDPRVCDRAGLRYLDRVAGGDASDFGALLRAEVAGIMNGPLSDQAVQVMTHCVFSLPDSSGQLMARWGLLPPNATIDPNTLEPIDKLSWILDLDAATTSPVPFDPEALMSQMAHFADRIYAFFRWVVSDAFISRFGGET